MGKLSQIHMELEEQATELGFESLEQALTNGYCIDYENSKLVKQDEKDDTPDWCKRLNNYDDEQEKAHEAWLEEKEQVLGELISVYNDIDVPRDNKKYLKHAIDFIKKGEC